MAAGAPAAGGRQCRAGGCGRPRRPPRARRTPRASACRTTRGTGPAHAAAGARPAGPAPARLRQARDDRSLPSTGRARAAAGARPAAPRPRPRFERLHRRACAAAGGRPAPDKGDRHSCLHAVSSHYRHAAAASRICAPRAGTKKTPRRGYNTPPDQQAHLWKACGELRNDGCNSVVGAGCARCGRCAARRCAARNQRAQERRTLAPAQRRPHALQRDLNRSVTCAALQQGHAARALCGQRSALAAFWALPTDWQWLHCWPMLAACTCTSRSMRRIKRYKHEHHTRRGMGRRGRMHTAPAARCTGLRRARCAASPWPSPMLSESHTQPCAGKGAKRACADGSRTPRTPAASRAAALSA